MEIKESFQSVGGSGSCQSSLHLVGSRLFSSVVAGLFVSRMDLEKRMHRSVFNRDGVCVWERSKGLIVVSSGVCEAVRP